MKLINPETNEEYEVVKEIGAGDGSGKNFVYEVKPVDSWPIRNGRVYELQMDLPDYEKGSLFKFYHDIAGNWEFYKDISDEKGAGSYVETINMSLADWLTEHYEDEKYLKAWKELSDE